MIKLTKNITQWLSINHPDKLLLITSGQIEVLTKEIWNQYMDWLQNHKLQRG